MIIDTDIGYDPDDFFALLLALKSPEIDILLITTADEVLGKRAVFTRTILEMTGDEIKVVKGIDLGNHSNFIVDSLVGNAIYNISDNYVGSVKKLADNSTEPIIYLGIGGFTNLADFLKTCPGYINKFEIYMMGGAINYSRGKNWIEHNVRMDKEAARFVLNTGGNISLIMAQTTFQREYEIDNNHSIFKKLKSSNNPADRLLAKHVELFNEKKGVWPLMHDPLTFATAIGKDFVTLHKSRISIDENGKIILDGNGEEIRWSDPVSKRREFMEFLEERLFA